MEYTIHHHVSPCLSLYNLKKSLQDFPRRCPHQWVEPTNYLSLMLSIRNKLIYNDATLTSSSSITAFFTSYRFIPDMYLAIFELRLLNNQTETLKIPVNKFGMPLIARLINIDTNLPATIECDPFTSTEVWQGNHKIYSAQIKQENNQAFMVEALQHSYVIG